MYKVTKEFHFEMAHCLDGHDRGCNNVHGHSYKLEVTLGIDNLIPIGPAKGMVMDFGWLKNDINTMIVDHFDHTFAYDTHNKNECKIANLLTKLKKKTLGLPFRTTCENMTEWIARRIADFYDSQLIDLKYIKVKLWETRDSYAEVEYDI
ncbi:MAG: 6-carboxytetrahydropterin synthase [Malacoplasma sp.]|nr:6-carboxytetrahydropterin synthase [Malacoplasma sp.]